MFSFDCACRQYLISLDPTELTQLIRFKAVLVIQLFNVVFTRAVFFGSLAFQTAIMLRQKDYISGNCFLAPTLAMTGINMIAVWNMIWLVIEWLPVGEEQKTPLQRADSMCSSMPAVDPASDVECCNQKNANTKSIPSKKSKRANFPGPDTGRSVKTTSEAGFAEEGGTKRSGTRQARSECQDNEADSDEEGLTFGRSTMQKRSARTKKSACPNSPSCGGDEDSDDELKKNVSSRAGGNMKYARMKPDVAGEVAAQIVELELERQQARQASAERQREEEAAQKLKEEERIQREARERNEEALKRTAGIARGRGERLRRDAERRASLSSNSDPPIVDHAVLLTEGKLEHETHYTMLGIWPDADDGAIRRAFHKLSKKWHPDKNPEHVSDAESIFKEIKGAYETLSEEDKRRKYDKTLLRAP